MSTVFSLICLDPSFQKMTHHCLLHGSLRPTNLEKKSEALDHSNLSNFLALLCVMFSCVFVTFPYDVLGQVWYLIVLIPDLCLLPYFFFDQNGWLVLFGLMINVPVNSCGNVRTVSSPNHTFFVGKLD